MTMRGFAAAIAATVGLGTAPLALAADDIYQTIFKTVDQGHLQTLLKDMTGQNPVTVGTDTFSITNRYNPADKAHFRQYWSQYFQSLGLNPQPLSYDSSYSIEPQGHDIEAVLPGKVADSIVIIVHYDSIGPHGADNAGVDDDMTGMATLMETARVFVQNKAQLHYTVRFVAADYEEWGGLEGARYYANYIQTLSQQQNFKIVAAIDDEQSGWKEGDDVFDVFDCGGDTDSKALGKVMLDTAAQYSTLGTTEGCMGENSDHYAMWEIGVPAVVFSEHDPFNNGHFDREGGDTYDKIDQDYFFKIAQVGVEFAAKVALFDQ